MKDSVVAKFKVYEYSACSSCKKALKYLEKKKADFVAISIVEQPPSLLELKKMLSYYDGEIGKLFNTSGVLYREMKLSTKLPTLSESEALSLLSKNGKLVKRPFILGKTDGCVGFKEEEWKALLS